MTAAQAPVSAISFRWLLALVALWTSVPAQAYELDQWIQNQSRQSAIAMMANIGPTPLVSEAAAGAVAASPSRDPYYRYHWVRDGALVMDVVVSLYERASTHSERARYLKALYDFVDFSRRNQLTPNPSGSPDGLGLGEPKFNLDGSAFTGPWGRPQNDGPALRASTLIRLAHILLDQGRSDYVREKLYASSLPANTVIKADLEFVSHHWRDSSFDLWEEVRGKHFYTRLVQRRSLVEGAALAERLGDKAAAKWYLSQARELENEISWHWDAGRGYITVTLDRDGGLDYKWSGLDSAVILATLHGSVSGPALAKYGDNFFRPTDDRILATAEKIQDSFRVLYGINGRDRDWDNQPLGTAIGRYPEDNYSGTDWDKSGNPWFLTTYAYAELYYRAASAWERQGYIRVTPVNAALFNRLKVFTRLRAQAGETIGAEDARFFTIIRGLREAGDDYLRRGRFHAGPNGSMSEQLNRDSGFMQSAEQLTWSHASLLTAVWARGL